MVRTTIESRDPFVFTACCASVAALDPACDTAVVALRPREVDVDMFSLTRSPSGQFPYKDTMVAYTLESSAPLTTEGKPERYRELHLDCDKDVALDFVRAAITQHREKVMAPRGTTHGTVRYSWNEEVQCWDHGKLVPHRPLSSVYLPDGIAQSLMEDLTHFVEAGDVYRELHIAPVRVYLLFGVPGSGKTSLVQSMACETGHNLATVKFGSCDDDFATALRRLPKRSFVCIEDIDSVFDKRANKHHGVTFSALLAALDGLCGAFGSSDPVPVFLTTNVVDALDPALRRRVDFGVEFGYASKGQCRRMFDLFYPDTGEFERVWSKVSRHKFSMSVMHKFLVRTLHSGDPGSEASETIFDNLMACTYSGGGGARNMYS
jgi:hypothetical protein